MSLISTASPWTNDNVSRKKVSTLQKTMKLRPYTRNEETEEFIPSENNRGEFKIQSIDDIQTVNEGRLDRVSKIIEKMTNLEDNDSAGMADFNPISNPELVSKKANLSNISASDSAIPNPTNEIQLPVPMIDQNISGNPFYSKTGSLGSYSNYQVSYDASKLSNAANIYKHYQTTPGMQDHKMMEKLNYMIHLLENQENEKTANITEEFILYTFLGVFVIFVLDSFARSGKYVR